MMTSVLLAVALTGQVMPGVIVYICPVSRETDVPVAADFFAKLEFMKAGHTHDQTGINELYSADRVFAVPVGTAVRVLQFDRFAQDFMDGAWESPSYEVRILEGKYKDRKGWVDYQRLLPWRVRAPQQPQAAPAPQQAAPVPAPKSKLTPAQRDAQIQKNLAKNKAH